MDAEASTIERDDIRAASLESGHVEARFVDGHIFNERELRVLGWQKSVDGDWSKGGEPELSSEGQEIALRHGDQFLSPISKSAKFSGGPGRHHRPYFSDYDHCRDMIWEALGDISDDEVWDHNVLCAVFCRPNVTPGGIYITTKEVKEDWWQHKAVMILKLGPDAFQGDELWQRAKWGRSPAPAVNDWLFARPEAGVQINLMGKGGSRPQGRDHRGQPMDVFEWDGWPCRIIPHGEFLGRTLQPHHIV